MEIKNTILITGCSSGIGLDCALKFQQKGWHVIASCRNVKELSFLNLKCGLDAVQIDYEKPLSIKKGLSLIKICIAL